MMKKVVVPIFLILFIAVLMINTAGPAFAQEVFELRSLTGIPYMTGGVGIEERAYMVQKAGAYNLQLIFSKKTGEYVAKVKVVLLDSAGNKLLDIWTTGPWLFVKLEPGLYTVKASYKGELQVLKDIEVTGELKKVIMSWE